MKLIIDEKEIVDNALQYGQFHTKPSQTINCLIKYYFSIGMDRVQVRQSIEEFMRVNYLGFNSVKWADKLDNWVQSQEKKSHELFVLRELQITHNELHFIRSLDNIELEKLSFVYLVYAKIIHAKTGKESYINISRSEIFKDAKVVGNVYKQRLIINDLLNLGVIEKSKRDNLMGKRVLFVDNNSDPEIVINDFRNFVYAYLGWRGEKIVKCLSCNMLIRKSSHNKKYCHGCRKLQDLLKYKKYNERRNRK